MLWIPRSRRSWRNAIKPRSLRSVTPLMQYWSHRSRTKNNGAAENPVTIYTEKELENRRIVRRIRLTGLRLFSFLGKYQRGRILCWRIVLILPQTLTYSVMNRSRLPSNWNKWWFSFACYTMLIHKSRLCFCTKFRYIMDSCDFHLNHMMQANDKRQNSKSSTTMPDWMLFWRLGMWLLKVTSKRT